MKTCLNITHLKQQSKLKTSLTPKSTSICYLISLHPFMVKSPKKKMIANRWIHLRGSSSFLSLSVAMAKIYFYFSPKIDIPQGFPISVNDTIIYLVFRPQILESCLSSLSHSHYLQVLQEALSPVPLIWNRPLSAIPVAVTPAPAQDDPVLLDSHHSFLTSLTVSTFVSLNPFST